MTRKSVLMICGDYMEDYEAIVPFHVLQAFGIRVHCASPNKRSRDTCFTAVHDYMGHQLYTELQGHHFTLNANWDELNPDCYDALIIPGGRFSELFSAHNGVLRIVSEFDKARKPIAVTCHSQLILIAAGALQGKKCTAFWSLKPVIKLAGGVWSEPDPITSSLLDSNIISAVGWPAHAQYLDLLLRSMGAKIVRHQNRAILFLCGDYVEDYEINVPFQAMGALGCRVEAVSPGKKKGDKCVTAIHDHIHDPEGVQVCSERQGHNVVLTADLSEICVDDYDCLVIPGGRSPEFLVMDDKVVSLVKEFADKKKIVSGIGHGKLLLVAAGLLQGKRCASSCAMKAIVMVGGGLVESTEAVADGELLTATGWPALPQFVSQLAELLGFSVVF
ncbi:DJ-1 protein homolog E [Macadamia integrifolia]|uniref:DJ-1 protein homolog E n=1 Tax=Macadamia integrifolia TaxID=60698 RepID=UPI001C4FE728|nr:DJ-1 protein homolog E [Macadamia integrifolia]